MSVTSFMGGSLTVRTNGKLLRSLREAQKLKQQEVQDACKIKSNRLTAYEAGKPANIYDLRALANFYQVDVEKITDRRDLKRLAKIFNDLAKMYPRQIGNSQEFVSV